MTDRGHWLGANPAGLNIRRLMYQTLMWRRGRTGRAGCMLSDYSRSLGAPFDTKQLERPADALVDGVRRDI
jgi:hypothetical protein